MLIALNTLRRRHRHRLAAVLATFGLCWLLLAAHSALAEQHMGDDMAVCLAVAQTAALMLAVALGTTSAASRLLPRSPWLQIDVAAHQPPWPGWPEPRSRAGPELLQVFRQ